MNSMAEVHKKDMEKKNNTKKENNTKKVQKTKGVKSVKKDNTVKSKNEVKQEETKKGLFTKIRIFFNGVKGEFSKIHWTSKENMVKYSIATIFFILFCSCFFYLIDIIFALVRSIFN